MKSYFSLYKQQGHEIRERNCEYPTFPNKIGLNHRNLGTGRYISSTSYCMRTLKDQTLTFCMSARIIPTFPRNPQAGIAASASASTVFLPPRHPPPRHGLRKQMFYQAFQLWNSVDQGQLPGRATYTSSDGPCASLMFCCHHLQSLVFEQGIPHFLCHWVLKIMEPVLPWVVRKYRPILAHRPKPALMKRFLSE